MAVKLSPFGPNPQWVDANGNPASGYKLFFYGAGSSTKQNTYTDSTGNTANSNPITLNSLGQAANAIWFTEGQDYKAVLAPPSDTDPPASPVWTRDNLSGINDASITIDQWVSSGVTPTYVSATQFTVPGDQTSAFTVNRRIKATVTAGTVYGYISVSAYTTLTTVTVVLDSGSLDSGLSAVSLGLITPTSTSLPQIPGSVTTAMLKDDVFNGLTTVTPATGDYVVLADVSDSGNKKKGLVSAIGPLFTGKLIGYQVFTSSGTYTKATNSPTFVVVEVQGGGGGGGGSSLTGGNAAGGGAGGYSMKKIAASSLAASETVTIGAGGTAGSTAGGTGGTGGTSSFGSHCTATGGSGGTGVTSKIAAAGGAGGAGASGDLNLTGAVGTPSTPNATDAMGHSGTGGSSKFGGNGIGRTGAANAAGGNAVANSGSGGGGAAAGASSQLGGTGGSGIVIVWEYE